MRNALCCILVAISALAGCSTPPPAEPAPLAAAEYDAVYAATRDVLRDKGFVLDRQDYRFGMVTTEPRPTGTVLEPWIGLYQSPKDALDATLDRHRRIVRVALAPTPDGAQPYELDVQVYRERLALPTRRAVVSGSLRRTFDRLDAVPTEWSRRGITASYWEPVDRDPGLERRLRDAILKRAQKLAAADTTPL